MPAEADADEGRWARRLAVAGLLFGCLALALRYYYAATTSLTYDEATYVELAKHPWHSSYYPDRVFARHPPLAFLLLGGWTSLFGGSEPSVRLWALLCCVGAAILVWDSVHRRAGPAAATLAGVLLGLSFPWLVYGVQSTMYPLAVLFIALATHAESRGRDGLTKAALTAAALTHLFGFLFLALWIWKRPDRRRAILHTAPAWLWLVGATIAVLAARNAAGPGLGPAWQAARGFELFYALTQDQAAGLRHAFAFFLALLMLNPILLERGWFETHRRSSWAIGLAVLTTFLLTGPAFLRYTAILVPVAFFVGFHREDLEHQVARRAAIAVVIALAALTGATAYVNSGLDSTVQNDVPGLVDWRAAAGIGAASDASRLVVAAPPPVAYYLERDHGFEVTRSADGPRFLPMERPDGRSIEVHAASGAAGFRGADDGQALLVVLDTQTGTLAELFRDGYRVCASVRGAYVLSATAEEC